MSAVARPAEVAPGVHRIVTPLAGRISSLYLLTGEREALLFDTGVDGAIPAHVLPALAELGVDASAVRTVVVSHADVDHFGGVADARAAFPRARMLAGRDDIPLIEDFDRYLDERGRGFLNDYGWDEAAEVIDWCRSVTREARIDAAGRDGDEIDLGAGRVAIVRAVPGHSHGHLAIEAPWADAMLVADAVLGRSVDLADGTPAFPPTYRYVEEYLATIERLEGLGRNLLLTAHYPVLQGASARAFLAASRDFVVHLDALVLAELDGAPEGLTLAELLSRLNPRAGRWPAEGTEGALAFPVAGHLERYLATGRLRRAGERAGAAVWTGAQGVSA